MTEQVKSWLKNNATLVYFLVAQAFGIGTAVLSITAYMTKLESRVNILETRGSPRLTTVDHRLSVLESQTQANKASLERVIDVMTKRLNP